MKRNMVPLLGIAFVVAIISTGVFYGLFAGKLRSSSELPTHAIVVAARDLDRGTVIQASDLRVSQVPEAVAGTFSKPEDAAGGTLMAAVKSDEPLLEERVTGHSSQRGTGDTIPAGMRAVTLHVYQSETVLNMLRPGSRVDLQAVSERNGTTELKTVLDNVQVLGISPADGNGNRPAGAGVTVLIRAQETDLVALADAGSKMRVALRNPFDEEVTPHRPIALGALFASGFQPQEPVRSRGGAPSSASWDHPVQLRVRVLSVTDAAAKALGEHSDGATPAAQSKGIWRVAAFRSGDDPAKIIRELEQKHELEIVDGERLMAGIGRPISYHAGSKPDEFRVRFSPQVLTGGKLSVETKPQIGNQAAPEAHLLASSSYLMELATDSVPPSALARLFPGRSWEQRHLVVLVSARALPQQASDLAVARADRRR